MRTKRFCNLLNDARIPRHVTERGLALVRLGALAMPKPSLEFGTLGNLIYEPLVILGDQKAPSAHLPTLGAFATPSVNR